MTSKICPIGQILEVITTKMFDFFEEKTLFMKNPYFLDIGKFIMFLYT